MLRTVILILLCMGATLSAHAQLTLEQCQQKARDNYPQTRQYGLVERIEKYTLDNASKAYLPQLSLSGKASYQSDATKLPFTLPDISFTGLPKDQYQLLAEIQQNLWDGRAVHFQKKQAKAATDEAERQLDISLYALRERVNQIFFSLLLLKEQLHQNQLMDDELHRSLRNVEAYCANGIANDADIDAVKVELLNNRQQRISLTATETAYRRMLSLLMGEENAIGPNDSLVVPSLPQPSDASLLSRPELAYYAAQEKSLLVQEQGLQTGYLPRLSLFLQGGYGNPGLNLLKNKFDTYYIAGVRMNWNFGSLYTLRDSKRKLSAEIQKVENDRDLFLFNTRLQLAEQNGKIEALKQQMEKDEEIIRLRTNIRRAAEAKVANGTLTVTEMLRELDKENLARQDKALHEIQWLMNLYEQKHITN